MTAKRTSIFVISLALILIAAACSTFFYLKDRFLKNLPLTEELSVRFQAADKKVIIQKNGYKMWWKNDEGYSILASTTESILVVKAYYDGWGLESYQIADTIFKNELAVAKDVFTARGFALNKNNSSASTADESLWDYVRGYEKGEYLCTVTVSADLSSYSGSGKNGKPEIGYQLNISCTDKLAKAELEQIPFLDALELKDKEQYAMPLVSEGDYFRVDTGGRRGGQSAILKKKNDKYRILALTQESLRCSLIKKEQIPESISSSLGGPGCYADNGADYIQGIYEPFSYLTTGVAAVVYKETKPFDYTAAGLEALAAECGVKHKEGYFEALVEKFQGEDMTVYNFKYQGESQGEGIYKITLIPNKAGYASIDQFERDFDICAVGGDAYPKMLNDDWLLFVSSRGGGADDDSGRPQGSYEIQKIVEPSLKFN